MNQVFLEFFYLLGKKVAEVQRGLSKWKEDHAAAAALLHELHDGVSSFTFQCDESMMASREAAKSLMEVIAGVLPDLKEPLRWEYADMRHVIASIEDFERSLEIDLSQRGAFLLSPRGTHDSVILLQRPEASFETRYWALLPGTIRRDWELASQCLALNIPTACGFHAVRALEGVVLSYLGALKVNPEKHDLDACLSLLTQHGADPKGIEAAGQLRDLDRNLLTRPQHFLETDDAIDVFDQSKCAIRALLRDMEQRGLIKPKEPVMIHQARSIVRGGWGEEDEAEQ